ncbi:fasciclin domain-containing protein [Neptuniibacter caesariensis]|uniref:FAS1 domain-containing protein n=1 Tax=Neptuniibacter caesariensis TaxID=207954 RepID=A0A7U8C9N1_NEPCE|nr:fasciclin domain-containing protein [Neptuniibacter caesariensis]EAR62675.1 hypothetical protein MED92_06138 [Oceanospirillum sp. MED92] [Neptuniibacter caesariensis]
MKFIKPLLLSAALLIPFSAQAGGHGDHSKKMANDIVHVAASAETFSTLVAAVKAAELVDTLKSAGPFTVFAPTNDAFAKLPAGTVESLLKPENKDKLVAVLTYHVVPGKVSASQVVNLDSAVTVQGDSIDISVKGQDVMIDNAKVVKADIMASNGIIHVIDQVILPNMTPKTAYLDMDKVNPIR